VFLFLRLLLDPLLCRQAQSAKRLRCCPAYSLLLLLLPPSLPAESLGAGRGDGGWERNGRKQCRFPLRAGSRCRRGGDDLLGFERRATESQGNERGGGGGE